MPCTLVVLIIKQQLRSQVSMEAPCRFTASSIPHGPRGRAPGNQRPPEYRAVALHVALRDSRRMTSQKEAFARPPPAVSPASRADHTYGFSLGSFLQQCAG